jgi:hypothetical protein
MYLLQRLGYRMDDPEFNFRAEATYFSLSAASRLSLELTQPLIQCLLKFRFQKVKQPRREADHAHQFIIPEVKNTWSYS